jgi:hypothetical protein
MSLIVQDFAELPDIARLFHLLDEIDHIVNFVIVKYTADISLEFIYQILPAYRILRRTF